MRADFLILEKEILDDLQKLEPLFDHLEDNTLGPRASEEEKIVTGYRLHGVYNAIENILRNIARTFENSIDDHSSWHQELLRRMKLDLLPIRPAVLDEQTFEKLDELRKFRHVFRVNYGVELDAERMAIPLRKCRELRPIWQARIEGFLDFLRSNRNS